MKLTSGCIFWPQVDAPAPAAGALDRDVSAEVAIIGGGITGALAAYHLTREGLSVVLVDRRPLVGGSTAASTGLLQYEIDVPLVRLSERLGTARAERAYRASLQAVEAFPGLVAELGDDCGLSRRPSLYLACDEKDVADLQAEHAARRAVGIDVEFLSAERLQREAGISRPAALRSRLAFEIDPYRLAANLLRRSLGQGLRAYQAEVQRYDAHSDGVVLHTSGGPAIAARKVLFATGYETPTFLPRDVCRLRTTYALVSEPLRDFWPDRCLIWESGRPYFYLRATPDGRAMLGGEDEDHVVPSGPDPLIPTKSAILCEKFHTLFPRLQITPACAWSGVFAETDDGLPYIGSVPEFPHGLFALGYGGNGITFSLLAAWILRDAILGRTHPDAEFFSFARAGFSFSPSRRE